ncbi:MAG: Rieske (2Fe-2S) domain protein [Rhizobacter sp.]|nr:Rieske (2Fe-2S) domain protein [Rhizobacter sp.]
MRTSLSMKPTGWFQIGWTSTVPAQGVVPLRYFGQDLVAWRDKQGVVHVMDAYCQHLGANLAYGGTVTDSGIQCPFHGWTWGPDGSNVAIPYQERPHKGRKIRTWHVQEKDDVLFLWHDLEGGEPTYEVPDLLTDVTPHITGLSFQSPLPDGTSHYPGTQVHPQYVLENSVDPEHFRFVHGTAMAPVILQQQVTDSVWHTVAGFGRRWADGVDRPDDRRNTITIHSVGVGFAYNAELTPEGWRLILIATTPVDDDTTEIFGTYWLEDVPGSTPEDRTRRLDLIKGALPQDIVIWDNQKFLDPPSLATKEAAGFRALRQWSTRFYPDPDSSPAPAAARRARQAVAAEA